LESIAELLNIGVGCYAAWPGGKVGAAVFGPGKLPPRFFAPSKLDRVMQYFKLKLSARNQVKAVASTLWNHDSARFVDCYHHGWHFTI